MFSNQKQKKMTLNKINLTDVSKVLASAAVIYGSAFINSTLNAWIKRENCLGDLYFWGKHTIHSSLYSTFHDNRPYFDNSFKAALCLESNQQEYNPRNNIPNLKCEFATQAFFTVGAYKLVDSVFSFDSIHAKAGAAGVVGALGGIVDSILNYNFFNEGFTQKFCTLAGVNMLFKGTAAAALTYILSSNSEDEPSHFESVSDAEPMKLTI